jgi:uncharacterized membrane protein YkoI
MPASHRFILVFVVALTSAAFGTFAADSEKPAADVQGAQKSGEVLSQDEIIQRAKAQQPGDVTEIELDHKHGRYVYEVDIKDEHGVKTEMKFDAKTGELISKKIDKDDEDDTAEDDD